MSGVQAKLGTPSALKAAVMRLSNKLAGLKGPPLGKVLAFMPCKGGSGATFIATNLGYQLAETHSVLLIDLNLQFGDALSFVSDARPASTLATSRIWLMSDSRCMPLSRMRCA